MTDDLTPPEHEHSAAVDEAARWLAMTPNLQLPRPVIPALRGRFDLSVREACQAIAEANLIRARAT